MKVASKFSYLIIVVFSGCELINPQEVLRFEGQVSCENCSLSGPIEGINIRIDFPRANGTFESDSETAITDASGNYKVTKKVDEGEFKTYYAEVDEPYLRECDNGISPTTAIRLPTDLLSSPNIKNFRICEVGKIQLKVKKDFPESLDSLIIKSTMFLKSGSSYHETIRISISRELIWIFYPEKVSDVKFDLTVKKENGTISESTLTALVEPKQTKQLAISY